MWGAAAETAMLCLTEGEGPGLNPPSWMDPHFLTAEWQALEGEHCLLNEVWAGDRWPQVGPCDLVP